MAKVKGRAFKPSRHELDVVYDKEDYHGDWYVAFEVDEYMKVLELEIKDLKKRIKELENPKSAKAVKTVKTIKKKGKK